MISIVMPVYNGAKFLARAIESIINQTYVDFELIIVNDCSNDRTLEIAKTYESKDKRIKVISNETNKKLPKSLNIGFSRCRGEFFTWTSDDNLLKPEALYTMMQVFNNNPKIGFVYSCEEFIDENGGIIGTRKHPNSLDDIYCANIISACFLYRKEVHEKLGGYNPDKFLVEDYDFFLRAYENFEFEYIPKILYQYRRHGGSLTSTRQEDIINRTIELLKEFYDDNKTIIIKNKINRGIYNFYLELASLYYKKVSDSKEGRYDRKRMKLHYLASLFNKFR